MLKEKRGCLPSSMVDHGKASILQFAPFQSAVDEGFWHILSSLKLNKLGIAESPIPITGFYAPCSHHQVSNHLTLLAESLPPESSEQSFTPAISRGNRNRCPVPGILYNTNSLEGFQALDKQSLLNAEAKKIWEDILSCKVEKDSSLLLRFLVVSYADLKKWSFHYWFAFPALILDPPATVVDLKPAAQWFSAQEVEVVATACNDWRNMISTTEDAVSGRFSFSPIVRIVVLPILNYPWWVKCQYQIHKNQETIRLCQMLLVGNLITEEKRLQGVSGLNLAFEAADLNLKLMRWRQVPSLNLNVLSSTRCLLLGAGTLGCQVARTLMEQMEAIQSQQCEGSNHKDPYGDMIKKPEHSGRVRTFGKGVTKTDLKNGGKSSSYIFPQEYLQSMQSQVVDQVLQANPELQKLLEANPGVKIVLPYVSGSGSNGHPQNIDSSEHISMGAYSDNQLVHVGESDGNEVENDDIDP